MSNKIQNQYTPDYVSPPGETLQEILEERSMSQAELAELTLNSKKAHVSPEGEREMNCA